MATVTRVTLTCDLCGDARDVTTWTFGLDGTVYEIDLCPKDGTALGRVAGRYIANARTMPARPGRRPARRQQAATTGGAKATGAGAKQAAQASRPQDADGTSAKAARAAGVRQQKGIYVYGVLPGDIEVTEDRPGVGDHPGLLREVRVDGLAALVSDVDMPGRPGSPEDLRTYREILDATAAEVPVVPLRFGTILASEDAVAELLAARHQAFTAALERLEGRAEFRVKGRYVTDAILGEVLSQDKQAARLRAAAAGTNADTARTARIELDQLMNQVVTAWRDHDTRTVQQLMQAVSVASAARKPAGALDAVHLAFLVDVGQEHHVQRVIQDLARQWEGRIDLQLLGPTAAYHFTRTTQPER